ncbi:hypothetical protein [Streptomyces sp. NPDC047043]|uniref:hypothetical protein n=1 Tax=Streptomyces sp. NPDC047043 TaxID=3154497 RepID=UPI0033E49C06
MSMTASCPERIARPGGELAVRQCEPWGRETSSSIPRERVRRSHTPNATDVSLLNPCVITPDGEWEAWYLAHWLPGAVRYRSFRALMNDEYETFHG